VPVAQVMSSLPQPVVESDRQVLQSVDASSCLQALSAQAVAHAPVQVQSAYAVKAVFSGPSQSSAGLPSGVEIASEQVYFGSHIAVPVLMVPPLPPTPVAVLPVPVAPLVVLVASLPPVPVLLEVDETTVQALSAKVVIAPRRIVKDRMFIFTDSPGGSAHDSTGTDSR
jgi:hypothetical protein